jgi:hypothetical protein
MGVKAATGSMISATVTRRSQHRPMALSHIDGEHLYALGIVFYLSDRPTSLSRSVLTLLPPSTHPSNLILERIDGSDFAGSNTAGELDAGRRWSPCRSA